MFWDRAFNWLAMVPITLRIRIKLPFCHIQCRHLITAINVWAAQTTIRLIVTQFPWQGCMDDLITKLALIRKLCESLMCLAYFLTFYPNYGCLYNRALANVLSTSGGIKCLSSDCQRLIVDWIKIAVGMFHTRKM